MTAEEQKPIKERRICARRKDDSVSCPFKDMLDEEIDELKLMVKNGVEEHKLSFSKDSAKTLASEMVNKADWKVVALLVLIALGVNSWIALKLDYLVKQQNYIHANQVLVMHELKLEPVTK